MTALPPLRRELIVDAAPAVAFAVFTERIGSWWPLATLSVYGEGSAVAFQNGAIVESAPSRPDTVWGTVTDWDPPHRLAFTWHPGAGAERASQVSIRFDADGEQTVVRLEHSGWEVFADAAAARAEYENGWPLVIESFGAAVSPQAGVESEPARDLWTWAALVHRPGPAAPATGSVFEDPRFGDHLAFLDRMQQKGFLVAAGPLMDEAGAGMTVIRLPGEHQMAEATRLAEIDDTSVACGFFTVTVRPWRVVMTA